MAPKQITQKGLTFILTLLKCALLKYTPTKNIAAAKKTDMILINIFKNLPNVNQLIKWLLTDIIPVDNGLHNKNANNNPLIRRLYVFPLISLCSFQEFRL